MSILDTLLRRNGGEVAAREEKLRETIAQYDATLDLYQERLAELELAREDDGWQRLGVDGELEFSRDTLDKIIRRARLMWLGHPLIRRSVLVQTYYVYGQGMTIACADERANEVLQGFWGDRKNRRALTGHQAQAAKENTLQIDGNAFVALSTNPSTGRVQARSVIVDEIRDIISNPDDREDIWFYRRRWRDALGRGQEALYPDWLHRPEGGLPDTFKIHGLAGEVTLPVRASTPLMHAKVGGLEHMRFGLPDFYAAMDWARSYRDFLEDWASLVRSLSTFAWEVTTKKPGAARRKLGTTRTASTGETNPPPVAGSVFAGDEGTKIRAIPKTDAHVQANDGRALRLMVAAATDIPDTMLANDPNMGNLATARTLDRPTELAMRDRQTLWQDFYTDLSGYVLEQAATAPSGALHEGDADRTVDVFFPSIREPNQKELVDAVVAAVTLGGKPLAGIIPKRLLARELLTRLGVQHVDKVLADTPGLDDEGAVA